MRKKDSSRITLELAEALLFCGELRREQLPGIAADLLEGGIDTQIVRQLAGLTPVEMSEAHTLFQTLLKELHREPMTEDRAANAFAHYLALLALEPGEDLRQVARKGAGLASRLNHNEKLLPFLVADDEYELTDTFTRADVDMTVIEYAKTLLRDSS